MTNIFVILGGILTLIMAVFHIQFPKILGWKDEFDKIGQIKGKVHFTIHIALVMLLIGIGVLSILYSKDLSKPSGLAIGLLVILSLFWWWRTIWQLLYFRLPEKAKSKAFHYLYFVQMAFFFALAIVYSIPIVHIFIP